MIARCSTFLVMSRQRDTQKVLNWAMIFASANYGRGLGDMINRISTYFGASKSFLQIVKSYIYLMMYIIANRLSGLLKTIWTLDNNQRATQRYSSGLVVPVAL